MPFAPTVATVSSRAFVNHLLDAPKPPFGDVNVPIRRVEHLRFLVGVPLIEEALRVAQVFEGVPHYRECGAAGFKANEDMRSLPR